MNKQQIEQLMNGNVIMLKKENPCKSLALSHPTS